MNKGDTWEAGGRRKRIREVIRRVLGEGSHHRGPVQNPILLCFLLPVRSLWTWLPQNCWLPTSGGLRTALESCKPAHIQLSGVLAILREEKKAHKFVIIKSGPSNHTAVLVGQSMPQGNQKAWASTAPVRAEIHGGIPSQSELSTVNRWAVSNDLCGNENMLSVCGGLQKRLQVLPCCALTPCQHNTEASPIWEVFILLPLESRLVMKLLLWSTGQ